MPCPPADNLFTGRFQNIAHWNGHPNFSESGGGRWRQSAAGPTLSPSPPRVLLLPLLPAAAVFFQHDVINSFNIEVDQIYHLACPASPPHYQARRRTRRRRRRPVSLSECLPPHCSTTPSRRSRSRPSGR